MIIKNTLLKLSKAVGIALLFAVIAVPTKAAMTYGNGYYTNLCDSGTSASYYSCDLGCDPKLGICQGEDGGVVKWICQGKWNQCLESESQWSNYEKLDSVGCGYSVQLSLFDKKCRRIDGSWDDACKLLGYMTWYSGDCYEGQVVTTVVSGTVADPTPTLVPVLTPKISLIPSPTITPGKITPTLKLLPSPTSGPVPGMCGVSCKLAGDCKLGFACMDGECRNPACSDDEECFCRGVDVATAEAILVQTPETGVETWLGMVAMLGVGWVGIRLRRAARQIW